MVTFFDFAFDATTDTTAGRFATFFEKEVTDPLDWSPVAFFSLAYAGPDTNDAISTQDSPRPKVFLFNTTTSTLETHHLGQ